MERIYLSPPDMRAADFASVAAVLESNWVAPVGPHLVNFESEVAGRVGRAHALAVNSGTAALHLALLGLGIGPGDVVLCPTLTFVASANPIRYCGAEPVFIDSEPRTWNMDPEQLEAAILALGAAGRTPKAVIVVHLYGQCAEMEAIEAICQQHELPLIEDAAEALGASYRGRAAGSMGLYSFFSFNGNKIITTSGGGMLLGDDAGRMEAARKVASQAREPVAHYEHRMIGYNYRMSNLLAGLGSSQLSDLDRRIRVLRGHFEAYRAALADLPGVEFMPISEPDGANYWLSCCTIDPGLSGTSRDRVIAALEAEAIEARPLWKPLHCQPVFKECSYFGGQCAEKLFENGLCLPSGSAMSAEQRARVIKIVRSCFSHSRASP